MIDKKEVQQIADLAKLKLTEKEAEKIKKDLSAILDYMEKLKKADVSEIEETSHSAPVKNIMRADEISKFTKKLIDGHLKVKSILK